MCTQLLQAGLFHSSTPQFLWLVGAVCEVSLAPQKELLPIRYAMGYGRRESLRYCSFTIPHPPYQTNSTYFAVPPLGDLVPWRVLALEKEMS